MKLWIVLLSLLAMAGTWWWTSRNSRGRQISLSQQLQTIFKSVLAGIVVYFCLVLVAAVYLVITTY